MRKAFTVILSLLMMLAMVPAASAAQHGEADQTTVEVVMEIGETTYTINGHADEMDVWPFILDGRTWVSFENEESRIELEIGSPFIIFADLTLSCDGRTWYLSQPSTVSPRLGK